MRISAILLALGLAGSRDIAAQQPTFGADSGPVVLVDMGHNTLLGAEPNLSPVTRLKDDGYVVRTLTGPITEAALREVDIAVIVGALGDRNHLGQRGRPAACGPPPDTSAECMAAWNARIAQYWRRPIPPAFSGDEFDAIEKWVRQGGGLFLVFDIFPFPGAIEPLVQRFGVEVSNGFAVDPRKLPDRPDSIGPAGDFVFRRVDGTLADHRVTNGRDSTERVDAVVSFVGSAFRLPTGGQSLLTFGPSSVSLLPDVAWEFSATTPRQSIAGWSQGGLLRVGEGRLAIFAESGILQPHQPRFDQRHPGARNSGLVLNVFHWLSGLLDERE